jgi:hypothetical protein
VNCGFSVHCISNNDNSAVILAVDENEWHSLQPSGMQSEDNTTRDSALEVCRIKSVDQVFYQQLTMPEEESEDDKISEHKAVFLAAMIEMEAAKKYMYQCDTEN